MSRIGPIAPRPISNPCSELTWSRSGWSDSNPTLAKPCRISPIIHARSAPSPSNIFIIADQAEMPNRQKSREKMVIGSLEQAIPEGFRNLSRFARSGFGGQNEADRCRSPSRPSFSLQVGGPIAPPRSYVPISAPIRASQRRPDQGTTKITIHRPNLWQL